MDRKKSREVMVVVITAIYGLIIASCFVLTIISLIEGEPLLAPVLFIVLTVTAISSLCWILALPPFHKRIENFEETTNHAKIITSSFDDKKKARIP